MSSSCYDGSLATELDIPADAHELDVVRPRRALHRAADWAGSRVDRVVKSALRGLYLRQGVPYMSPQELERSLRMLRCYTDPRILEEPDRVFAPPSGLPTFRTQWRKPVRGGTHVHYTFETPYRPLHRIYDAEFKRYDNLDTVHLFGWQHARPAPVTVLITHGWAVGAKRVHEREFGIDFLFRRLGIDVYYYVMPFHSLRKPSKARFSGELHPSPNLMRTNETFIQKVRELRTIIHFIRRRTDAPLGMMGSSLGGYTTALLASIDDRLDFAMPVMAMGSLAELFWEQGEGDSFRRDVEQMGMTKERFMQAWAMHSPLSYQPKTPWKGRLLVSAGGDGLVTSEHTEPLWHHWGRPRRHQFAGGHILQLYARDYHRQVGKFLVELGYLKPRQLEHALR